MDSDVTTIQRARGWRRCPDGCMYWVLADHASKHHAALLDPLADTPEGWWEFGQIIKWAHEKGWAFVLEIAVHHYCAVVNGAAGWMGNGYGDFRTAIIAALAEAVRRESEDKG